MPQSNKRLKTGLPPGICLRSFDPQAPDIVATRERLCPLCNRSFISVRALSAHVRFCAEYDGARNATETCLAEGATDEGSTVTPPVDSSEQRLLNAELEGELCRLDSRSTLAANVRAQAKITALLQNASGEISEEEKSEAEDFPTNYTDNFDTCLKPDAQFLLFQFALQQMQDLDPSRVMALRALRLPNGSCAKVLWEDYYDLHCFILENNLSESLGDRLLLTINKINSRHGVQVPLPSQFRTIQQAMKRHQNQYKHQSFIYDVYLDDLCMPPAVLNQRHMRNHAHHADDNNSSNRNKDKINGDTVFGTGARLSVLETVATMLLSCCVVDDEKNTTQSSYPERNLSQTPAMLNVSERASARGTNVTFKAYTPTVSGERVVCDVPSAEWFRETLEDIHHYYGDTQIGLLSIILSYDATTLTKAIGTSGRYTTPVYVTIGNVVTSSGVIPDNCQSCIGYFPECIITKAEIYKYYMENGMSTHKSLEFCYKQLKMHAEQVFLLDILQEIDRSSSNGGLLFQVGLGEWSTIVHVIPVVTVVVQDNQGAHKCLGVYAATNARRPCRFCNHYLQFMQQPGAESAPRSSHNVSAIARTALKGKIKSTCAKQYRERLTEEEQKAISYCNRFCIHPARTIALHDTYGRHTILRTQRRLIYNMCPPDEMHTLLGGLMKSWLFFTATIIERVAEYDATNYGRNVVLLDKQLKRFPTFCLPDFLKKFTFHNGLSGILEACSAKGDANTTSSLGGLSQQKYPHLIMQLLLCISIKRNGGVLPIGKQWCRKFVQPHAETRGVRMPEFCVSETVLTSGYVLLDLHFNLKRTVFSNTHLQQLNDIIVNAQFHTLRLYALKQILLGSTKKYAGIKMHALTHMPGCIALYGPPFVFDMVKYDHMHIRYVKQKFRQTSRRYCELSEKMLQKLQSEMHAQVMKLFLDQHLTDAQTPETETRLSCSNTQKMHAQQENIRPKFALKQRKRTNTKAPTLTVLKEMLSTHVTYRTEAGIVYEQSKNDSKIPFWYDTNMDTFLTRYYHAHRRGGEKCVTELGIAVEHNIQWKPLHPALTCEDLICEVRKEATDGDLCLQHLIQGTGGYYGVLLKKIKLDGNSQDLPVYTIHCNSSYKTSPESREACGRYDFVQLHAMEDEVPEGARSSELFFAQVAAIMSVHKGNECVSIYILCLWMEELHAQNGPEWGDLTPSCVRYLAYQKNRHNKVHRQLIKIDHILSPAFVSPLSNDAADLSRKSTQDLFRARFSAIDCQFFTRGGQHEFNTPLYYYLQCKRDNFPNDKRKILPFYLPSRDLAPNSEAVHRKYLPSFITEDFNYTDGYSTIFEENDDTNIHNSRTRTEEDSIDPHDYSGEDNRSEGSDDSESDL